MISFTELIIIIIFLIVWLGGMLWAICSDRKQWNNGKCPECGHDWRLFDMDSQGGRGYICDGCGDHMWISWSVDKRRK